MVRAAIVSQERYLLSVYMIITIFFFVLSVIVLGVVVVMAVNIFHHLHHTDSLNILIIRNEPR